MKYWLLKSEPETFSVEDLAKARNRTTSWHGVRNYQARNFLRDDVGKGDRGFFYHSSCAVPGVVGIVKIVRAGYPDSTAEDPRSEYFDPSSERSEPRWYTVDVQLERKVEPPITLDELRAHASRELKNMLVLKRGNRLSVTPVTREEWQFILSLR
ncbi:MAG TPA: EVE domain-containing protein [Steroidobacteraceae bacterium]|nr:EVE domain-containing protein [Steroidobacteraceae bacterium]